MLSEARSPATPTAKRAENLSPSSPPVHYYAIAIPLPLYLYGATGKPVILRVAFNELFVPLLRKQFTENRRFLSAARRLLLPHGKSNMRTTPSVRSGTNSISQASAGLLDRVMCPVSNAKVVLAKFFITPILRAGDLAI